MMKILGVVTLPVVRENKLEGLIVTGDIANPTWMYMIIQSFLPHVPSTRIL